MDALHTVIRLPLYIVLWVFSALLFILTAVRLNYTLHLPRGDPLNDGRDFYDLRLGGVVRSADPVVAELLVVSLMTLGTIPLVKGWVPNFNFLTSTASRNLVELGGLSVLWLLWLVGCVVSTSIWPDLSFCYQFEPCRILTAMMAFAWLGWIVLVGLIVVAILSTVAKVRPTRAPMTVEWASPSNMARSVTV